MRMRPLAVAGALVTALAVSVLGVPAQADHDLRAKQRGLEARIAEIAESVDGASREYVAAIARLHAVEAKLPAARAAVAEARGALAAAKAREAALVERLRVAEAQVRKAERELVEVEAEIKLGERDLGRLARSAYQDGAPSELSLYLDAASIDDVLDRLAYSESAARSETALLRRLADARADLAAQRATLEAKREHVANLREEAAETVVRQKALEAAAVAAEREVVRLVAEAKAAAAAIAAEKAAELRRMSVAKAESDRIGRVLAERAARAKAAAAAAAARARAAGRRAPTPRAGRSSGVGVLLRPVDGYVTSPYGMRVHPVTGVYKLHDGTDFGAPCGTPIYAAADGQVVEAGYSGAWGNRVVVDHGLIGGDGVGTGYNHMTDIAVRSGSVSRGQLVGWVGSTGYSTGCHLHLNVYVNGSTVDPMNYL